MSDKRSSDNTAVVASAGSRKTTHLVDMAIASSGQRVLITTFTEGGLDQIKRYLTQRYGCIPEHVTAVTWYTFLLRDGIRPYQSFLTNGSRIASILFESLPEFARRTKKSDTDRYYLTTGRYIYKDRAAEFVCHANHVSGGCVIGRLERVYDRILIDESQDMAAYDLDFLEHLFASQIAITCVGDPRQTTFTTNNSSKNKKFKKHIMEWLREREAAGVITIEERTDCYRCNQLICDFADSLFPQMPKTISKNDNLTGHDGIILINRAEVPDYIRDHNPQALRWDKRTNVMGLTAINFGASKGLEFDRVLIFPTAPMKEYLASKDLSKVGDVSKLYVAVTRARYSVAFVMD